MTKTIRILFMLAAVASFAGGVCLAQSAGEETYKAKCAVCHGADGMARTSIGLAWKVKPVTDPAVAKMDLTGMIEVTRNGQGKMQAFKDKLSDADLKASVAFFRTLIK